jgi:hypothetical protein
VFVDSASLNTEAVLTSHSDFEVPTPFMKEPRRYVHASIFIHTMDAVIHFVTRCGYCICPRASSSCARSDTIHPDTVLEREEWMRQRSSSLLSSHDGPPRLFCRVRLQLLSRLRRGGIRPSVFRVLGTRALAPSSYVSPGFSASLSVFFIARLCSPNALTRGSWARASLPWSPRLCLFHPPAPPRLCKSEDIPYRP